MASNSRPSITKHVPAWKKIGLKLKNAREEPEKVAVSNPVERPESRKRKSQESGDGSFTTGDTKKFTKRHKNAQPRANASTAVANVASHIFAQNGRKDTSPVQSEARSSSKRKSVSFAPNTKSEDGEGIKEVYENWVKEQKANDPSFLSSAAQPALKALTPAAVRTSSLSSDSFPHSTLSTSAEKPKKPKFKQKNKTNPSETSLTNTHPSLTYLTTYHTNPKLWKFSKSHQNYLLKNLFSLANIPPSYEPALLSYLRSLKSNAARSRVRTQATSIIEDDQKWPNSGPSESEKMDQETQEHCEARRKRDYDDAVARIKAELRAEEEAREEKEWKLFGGKAEWEARFQNRRRAESILWGVREEDDVFVNAIALPNHALFQNKPAAVLGGQRSTGMGGVERISSEGIAQGSLGKKIVFGEEGCEGLSDADGVRKGARLAGVANETMGRRKRKRKRRTTGVPDDDSSDSSSSSDSSEDEIEAKLVKALVNGVVKKPVNSMGGLGKETTSSSGSETDSDSDSSSDSSPSSESD
ncbi:hypothetical protein MMC21_001767 [Puttea exsequens]|nr:hypothetical protein [Puttea exsequens]